MTDDLDTLRPEVWDALQVFDGEAVCTCHPAYTSRGLKDPQCNHDLQESVDIIRAELLRLAGENKRMRGIIETLDIEGHRRAEKVEAELAAAKDKYQQDDGMAACMAMVRDECIKAGVFPDSLAPMFYPEAIIGMHAELVALKARIAEAPVYEIPLSKPKSEDGWARVIESVKNERSVRGKRVWLLVEE